MYLIFRKLLKTPNFFCSFNESKINIAISLRKLLFLYQKIFLTAISEQKVAFNHIPAILAYFQDFYIKNNDLFLNNPAILNLEDFKNEAKMEELQNNHLFLQVIDNETLLIIQALKINYGIINLLSYFAMVINIHKN